MSEALQAFNADIIHVGSPFDVSEIGVYIAKRMKISLAISWHANLHEFGALRLAWMLDWMGDAFRRSISSNARKPVFLMKRGIDTQLFSPSRRTVGNGVLRLDTWAA